MRNKNHKETTRRKDLYKIKQFKMGLIQLNLRMLLQYKKENVEAEFKENFQIIEKKFKAFNKKKIIIWLKYISLNQ